MTVFTLIFSIFVLPICCFILNEFLFLQILRVSVHFLLWELNTRDWIIYEGWIFILHPVLNWQI